MYIFFLSNEILLFLIFKYFCTIFLILTEYNFNYINEKVNTLNIIIMQYKTKTTILKEKY